MAYLCRECGSEVEVDSVKINAKCKTCNKTLTPQETISSWKLEARMSQLKAMHELMRNANDEEIYMTWIVTGVPDEPSEDDFNYIACDDELYNECFALFVELIKDTGNRW